MVAKDGAIALVSALDELAVPEREHPLGHDDRRRRTLLLGRIVEAREPIPRVLVLALRPEMGDFFGMLRRRLDKKQAGPGFYGAIGDGYCGALARCNRNRQLDLELTVARLKFGGRLDPKDFEIDGVERQAGNRLVERANRQRANAVERLVFEVRGYVQVDMFD